MRPDVISFLFGVMIIPVIALFIPKLLLNTKQSLVLFVLTLILAIVGLSRCNNGTNSKAYFYLFLVFPFYSLVTFRYLLHVFKLLLNRNPKVPNRNFIGADGLGWDMAFYSVFMALSLVPAFGIWANLYH